MDKLPKISVIITCHNYADLVGDAIRSVLKQDYPHNSLCMAIVNDGSTDNSRAIIENLIEGGKYIDKDGLLFCGRIGDITTFFISNKEPHKQAYARNQAIQATWNCDAFAILDADDIYREDKISKSVQKWQENSSVIGFVYSDLLIHNIDTGVLTHEMRQSYNHSDLMQSCITSNAPLISKAALAKCGLYDIEISPTEDYDLAIRISSQFLLVHIPECLSIYRVTGRNSTITTPREHIVKTHQLMREKLQGKIPYKYE